jgi:hypothetical protein
MEDLILDDNIHLPKTPSLESAREIMQLKTDYALLGKKIKNAKVALWIIIGFTVLGSIASVIRTNGEDSLLLIINGVYLALLIACAILVEKKKIFIGLLAGTVILSLLVVVTGFLNPLSLIGLVLKGPVIFFLVIGVLAVKEYRGTIKGLIAHGISVDGTEL